MHKNWTASEKGKWPLGRQLLAAILKGRNSFKKWADWDEIGTRKWPVIKSMTFYSHLFVCAMLFVHLLGTLKLCNQ